MTDKTITPPTKPNDEKKQKVPVVPPPLSPKPISKGLDIVLVLLAVLAVLLVILAILVFMYRHEITNAFTPGTQKPGLTLPPKKYWDSNLPRTEDKSINLHVDIENIYFGNSVQVSITKAMICPSCSGTGAKSPDHLHICTSCGGRGYQQVVQKMGYIQFQSQQICTKCHGNGKSISEYCPVCKGHGISYQEEKITIPIEKGAPEGFQIYIPYGSDESPNHAPGDLYFFLQSTSKNIQVIRDTDHFHFHLTISLLEALVGFQKSIPHIAGEVIIERNEVTIPGQIIVLPEKGMPIYKQEGKYGNLYVHITVQFPQELSPKEKEDVKKILGEEQKYTEDIQ